MKLAPLRGTSSRVKFAKFALAGLCSPPQIHRLRNVPAPDQRRDVKTAGQPLTPAAPQ